MSVLRDSPMGGHWPYRQIVRQELAAPASSRARHPRQAGVAEGFRAGIGPVPGYGALFFLGLATGLLSLVYYESWLASRRQPGNFGPGTMAPGELTAARPG